MFANLVLTYTDTFCQPRRKAVPPSKDMTAIVEEEINERAPNDNHLLVPSLASARSRASSMGTASETSDRDKLAEKPKNEHLPKGTQKTWTYQFLPTLYDHVGRLLDPWCSVTPVKEEHVPLIWDAVFPEIPMATMEAAQVRRIKALVSPVIILRVVHDHHNFLSHNSVFATGVRNLTEQQVLKSHCTSKAMRNSRRRSCLKGQDGRCRIQSV